MGSIRNLSENRNNLVELLQSDGTIILTNEDYAEEHFYKCDIYGKFHEELLSQIDDIQTACNKCLKENYELIDDSYVLKKEQAA